MKNKTALTAIRDEHRTISALLHALKELARQAEDDAGARPAFPALRAIIRYVDEFPEKLHHPKEESTLFARLLERAPQAAPLIALLREEHEKGARLVRELARAALFFEDRWPEGAREFRQAVDAYAEFHWKHMLTEEQELLPLAERAFVAEDWREIDAAFAQNPDFEREFTRIVNLTPAPVGLA